MYEAEIEQALDCGDLSALWSFMLKRTAWLQHASLDAQGLSRAQADTERISRRIGGLLGEIESSLGAARKSRQLAKAYQGEWTITYRGV